MKIETVKFKFILISISDISEGQTLIVNLSKGILLKWTQNQDQLEAEESMATSRENRGSSLR